ncbi:MAG TPA: SDR family oxidoreductase [Variovorax sp.]|nr:SDR family oxidoreductase [Variovorax sp.]
MDLDARPLSSVALATQWFAPKVVVITGASSGIGRATALAFARRGHHIVLAARSQDTLQPIADECEAAGGRALVVPTDVTDAAAVRALANHAIAHFGRVDVWFNNVGVGAVGLFDETPIEAHRRVVESNLLGHMNGTHAILPHFRAEGRGTLVNMISLGGWVPSPYATAYSATKFGLRGFSEALRAELSGTPDIHVCEIYPTFVDTPGITHGANYTGRHIQPPPPLLDPRRIASVVLSLAHRPQPKVYVGAPAWPGIVAQALAPGWVGKTMMWITGRALERSTPAEHTDGNLYEPSRGNAVDGGFRASRTTASIQASKVALAIGVVALAVWALQSPRRR